MLKKIIQIVICAVTFFVAACSHHDDANVVRVGTIAGPETQLMDVAKKVAKEKFGLRVKVITFTDYSIPNQALQEGEIDANAFQHYPFLLSQIKAHGYSLVPVGDTFLYPMGMYSKKIKTLSEVKSGDEIAIPNDPSNEARALLLLQKSGLITLKPNITINATVEDIATNPKQVKLIALSAAQLPRSLDDVTIAAINTNYAIPAGLTPSHALFLEQTDSPYINLIVARAADKNAKKIKELVAAYQSAPVKEEAKTLFGDSAIAGF